MPENDSLPKTVSFVIGTGRCGTHFVDRVMSQEGNVAVSHERHPMSDAFFRYCKWNDLKVDSAAFIETKRLGIIEDKKHFDHSFEASAYLSFSMLELSKSFGAKFLLLTRSPEKVVNSYIKKKWYEERIIRQDHRCPAGYQPDPLELHHPFSRIVPFGEEAIKWQSYSQVGKIAWYWKVLNLKVLQDALELGENKFQIQKLEEFDYLNFLSVSNFLGFESTIGKERYENIANSRPGTLYPNKTVHDWTKKEREEFEYEVNEIAATLGYEWRTEKLIHNEKNHLTASPPPKCSCISSLKSGIGKIFKR